jgi:hypothetical protein
MILENISKSLLKNIFLSHGTAAYFQVTVQENISKVRFWGKFPSHILGHIYQSFFWRIFPSHTVGHIS